MEFNTREIRCDGRSDYFDIIPLSCIHVGPVAFDKDKFRKVVKRIRENKNALWFTVGDDFDGINRTDKRFDGGEVDRELFPEHEDLDDLANRQLEFMVEETRCIAEKCLGDGVGNHEETLRVRYHSNIHKRFARHIGSLSKYCTPENADLGYSGILRLRFLRADTSRVVKINYFHGAGGGGGDRQLDQMMREQPNCDIHVIGHLHVLKCWQTKTIDIADYKDEMTEKTKILCQAGTFLRTKIKGARTYSEVKGHKLSAPGCTTIRVIPHDHERVKYKLTENCDGVPE